VSRAALAGLGLVAVAACALAPDVGPLLAGTCNSTDSRPETAVSFGADIRPLLSGPTGSCGCHLQSSGGPGPGVQLSGLDLSSFETLRDGGLISGARIVVAGDPCASILYQKLSVAPSFGSRMPLNGPPFLTDDQLRLIHDWIAEGAKDN
jgi:hypothetical protein